MHDIEKISLEAHVSLCEERYQALARRFDHFESRLDRLETLVQEIHDRIDGLSRDHSQRFEHWHWVVTGVLASTVAFLIAPYFS